MKKIFIIDGDNQTIVGYVKEFEVEETILRLEELYEDVSEDQEGDIIFYREL